MRRATLGALVAAAMFWPAVASAGELTFSLGKDDILGRTGHGAFAFGIDLRTDPLGSLGPVDFGAGGSVEGDSDGDVWLGVGPYAAIGFGAGYRIGVSVMAGAYGRGHADGDDLGSPVEFRSRIGISRPLRGPWRAGLAFEHKSNASLSTFNPGVETLFLTLSRPF